jgi:hypothetical protein
MSHGRDDDPPKGPQVLLLIPGKGGKPDTMYKRQRDEDSKEKLAMSSVEPRMIGEFKVVSMLPRWNFDFSSNMDSYTGKQVRGLYSSPANAGFQKIVDKNHFTEETIAKLAKLAALIDEDCKYSALVGCDDGRIRLFDFKFDNDGTFHRSVKTFDEPVVFFPNHYYRTKSELVKTLQERVDKQVSDLQRYFDPAYDQMNFAGFQ